MMKNKKKIQSHSSFFNKVSNEEFFKLESFEFNEWNTYMHQIYIS